MSAQPTIEELAEPPVLATREPEGPLTRRLVAPVLRSPRHFGLALFVAASGSAMLFCLLFYLGATGIGVWGNNIPVAWAVGITNFVWWIGIGHAGTFISAILLLLQQKWRTSINRIAEAMTLFAVINAAIFPAFHLGRPWFAYWIFPYPAEMKVWPQFRSALPWDGAAVSTYFIVSLLFWYLGLVPDLAVARDTTPERWRRRIYGVFSLGWRGSARDWSHYRVAYGLLGGLATPLVVSVHTVVSLDFAISQLPGWHSPIFPPYFVAGAIYSGFVFVLMLIIPIRKIYRLEDVITEKHLDACAKLTLATGWIVTYAYMSEIFTAWYGANRYERYTHLHVLESGPYAFAFWTQIFCNCIAVQALWSKKVRRSPVLLFVIAIIIQIGMWDERFVLIVTSLQRDFLPSSWDRYFPTWIDLGIFVGTVCFFFFNFLLFLRFVPFIPIQEVKELRHELVKEEKEAAA